MPNWAMNNLTITATSELARTIRMRLDGTNLLDEDLDAVLTAATDDPVARERLASELSGGEILTFQSHARCPEDDHWYENHLRMWGTKWDACEPSLDVREGFPSPDLATLVYSFDTAWSPPVPWLESFCGAHPDAEVYMYCIEESVGWLGTWSSEHGSDQVIYCADEDPDVDWRAIYGWNDYDEFDGEPPDEATGVTDVR